MGKQCKAMRKADGQHKLAQYMLTRKHESDGLLGALGDCKGWEIARGGGGQGSATEQRGESNQWGKKKDSAP